MIAVKNHIQKLPKNITSLKVREKNSKKLGLREIVSARKMREFENLKFEICATQNKFVQYCSRALLKK